MGIIKNYIKGEWKTSASTQIGDVWNPSTGEKIAQVPYSTAAELNEAVTTAKEAFWEWRCTPPLVRMRYLFRLMNAFEENFEDIARILVTEEGKTMDESRGEVRRMIENVEHATSATTSMTGYNLEDISRGIDCIAERQPMGVFGCIAPFNFPAMVPFWFLPYALATGNTFVLKPSEQVPMTQTRIFEIIDEIDFPEGVVNMVHGSRDVVNAMLDNVDIQGVSFVGQTSTAKYIYKKCGETGKRVQALGGAKNCVVVMPDANIDKSIPSLITSFYGCAGERCLSGSLMLAVGDVYDELKEKFSAAAKSLRVGNGLDEKTQMGPVISAEHKQQVLGYIEKGIEEGANLILDGRDVNVEGCENGFYIGPTIFDNVTAEMT
ncbi:MAG: aldehyde dehydrogenase family protein, partial [Candidatus Latescibacteria bacterium]|nr:aldehyde dehydrogenase family protein [Candidatus Latescibacterota bacterium]